MSSELSIEQQILEAKRKAELFSRSLQEARLREAEALKSLDYERSQWAKDLETKATAVDQLERELYSTVDALHSEKALRESLESQSYPVKTQYNAEMHLHDNDYSPLISSNSSIAASIPLDTTAGGTPVPLPLVGNHLSINTMRVSPKAVIEPIMQAMNVSAVTNRSGGNAIATSSSYELLRKMQEENKQLKQESTTQRIEIDALQRRIAESVHDVHDFNSTKHQLMKALTDAEGRLQFRSNQIQEYESEREAYKNVEARLRGDIGILEGQIAMLKSELSVSNNELRASIARSTQLEKKINEIDASGSAIAQVARITGLEVNARTLESSIEELKKALTEMEDLYRNSAVEVESTKQLLIAEQSKVREFTLKESQWNFEKSILAEEIEAYKKTVEDLQTSILTLQKELRTNRPRSVAAGSIAGIDSAGLNQQYQYNHNYPPFQERSIASEVSGMSKSVSSKSASNRKKTGSKKSTKKSKSGSGDGSVGSKLSVGITSSRQLLRNAMAEQPMEMDMMQMVVEDSVGLGTGTETGADAGINHSKQEVEITPADSGAAVHLTQELERSSVSAPPSNDKLTPQRRSADTSAHSTHSQRSSSTARGSMVSKASHDSKGGSSRTSTTSAATGKKSIASSNDHNGKPGVVSSVKRAPLTQQLHHNPSGSRATAISIVATKTLAANRNTESVSADGSSRGGVVGRANFDTQLAFNEEAAISAADHEHGGSDREDSIGTLLQPPKQSSTAPIEPPIAHARDGGHSSAPSRETAGNITRSRSGSRTIRTNPAGPGDSPVIGGSLASAGGNASISAGSQSSQSSSSRRQDQQVQNRRHTPSTANLSSVSSSWSSRPAPSTQLRTIQSSATIRRNARNNKYYGEDRDSHSPPRSASTSPLNKEHAGLAVVGSRKVINLNLPAVVRTMSISASADLSTSMQSLEMGSLSDGGDGGGGGGGSYGGTSSRIGNTGKAVMTRKKVSTASIAGKYSSGGSAASGRGNDPATGSMGNRNTNNRVSGRVLSSSSTTAVGTGHR